MNLEWLSFGGFPGGSGCAVPALGNPFLLHRQGNLCFGLEGEGVAAQWTDGSLFLLTILMKDVWRRWLPNFFTNTSWFHKNICKCLLVNAFRKDKFEVKKAEKVLHWVPRVDPAVITAHTHSWYYFLFLLFIFLPLVHFPTQVSHAICIIFIYKTTLKANRDICGHFPMSDT